MTPKYATVAAVASHLSISRSRLYELIGDGDIVAVKVGRRTLVDREAALAWVAAQPRVEISRYRRGRAA